MSPAQTSNTRSAENYRRPSPCGPLTISGEADRIDPTMEAFKHAPRVGRVLRIQKLVIFRQCLAEDLDIRHQPLLCNATCCGELNKKSMRAVGQNHRYSPSRSDVAAPFVQTFKADGRIGLERPTFNSNLVALGVVLQAIV